MRASRYFVLAGLVAALGGCDEAIPKGKAAYVGKWQAKDASLEITQAGKVAFDRVEGGGHRKIEGPIKGFDGNNFDAGTGPITTSFKVSAPPHQADGKWLMTVDGVEYTKAP